MISSQPLYFEELPIGQEWESAERMVTHADIADFANLTGDRQPIHLDEEFARQTPFQRRIAHGLLGISLACGLALESPPIRTQAFLGLKDWQFRAPIFIGDRIRVRTRVQHKEIRGRGKRGIVNWSVTVLNQDRLVVQEGMSSVLVECAASLQPRILPFPAKLSNAEPLLKVS